jgi:peptidoglycan/xylan/chitin deacetylase (PgdA/CDA1 family)
MPANPLSVLPITLAILIPAAAVPAETVRPPRTVAITIDDLPYAGGQADLETLRRDTRRILAALVAHDVPASGFVTGKDVLRPGETDERLDLLRDWRAAGMDLENHGFDHVDYVSASIPAYLDEVAQGMVFPQRLMAETGGRVRWFRAPYNHCSPDRRKRAALVSWLADRDLRLAPFTVEHADYAWNRVYTDALQRRDQETLAVISREYLDHLDRAFAFAEELSRDTFGREIPQVFLIHANAIHAEHLDAMLARLEERGYRFVSLQKAVADPAYASEDAYLGPLGISWLHRWRVAMGKPDRLRDEPDPPRWVLEAWKKLSSEPGK